MPRRFLPLLLLFGLAAFAGAQPAGPALFASRCATCHGLDAKGGEHAPNIAANPEVQRLSDTDLTRIVRNGIPAAGMPGFGASLKPDEIAAVIRYLRSLQGQPSPAASLTGNPGHGRNLFFARPARCAECHMWEGRGGFLGPDLTGYRQSHSPADIRDAILHPDSRLDPRRGTVIVSTRSGKMYQGVLRNEDNFSLQMQTPDGNFYSFAKPQLLKIERPARSLMPANYATTLSPSDLDDVIAFLAQPSAVSVPKPADPDDE